MIMLANTLRNTPMRTVFLNQSFSPLNGIVHDWVAKVI